ncbi:MAG: beta-galactosidase GalB [Verrucomicrobiales bacterium]|nr:beta-galactosidase GalB [Verrucomicrobiales bacterium]
MLAVALSASADQIRERLLFNSDWRFAKGDPPEATEKLGYDRLKPWLIAFAREFTKDTNTLGLTPPAGEPATDVPYAHPEFDDSNWRVVTLPHDWGIEGQFNQEYPGATGKLPWWGVGWYRKRFHVPASDAGMRLYLDIDGAMSYGAVWVNGRFAGGWPYGYASWRVDLTPHIRFGAENVIAIRLDNPPASSRWYPGGGIYRNVWLVKTGPVHVGQWGTFITTPEVTRTSATVRVQVELANHTLGAAAPVVTTEIYEATAAGRRSRRAVAKTPRLQVEVAPGAKASCVATTLLANPKLWSVESPHLYVAVTRIELGGKTIDQYETVFGVRTIKFDAAHGFWLNGVLTEIKGVCNHHDLGALGAALNLSALERQLRLLRELGCNAIRTSHNPPAPELLELCDRLGFLVMVEAFDCWRKGKSPNDYHKLFDDWHEQDLRAMVRRDRNHPCVILWSIGNEILEQSDPDGWQLAARLANIVRDEDPTRPVTAATHKPEAMTNGFERVLDVFGANYSPHLYAEFRRLNPNVPLLGSETASCVSSRGEYFFPVSTNRRDGRVNFQVTSYDFAAPAWAVRPDTEFEHQDRNPFVAGEFVWTGFDYLGEPTPYDRDSTNMLQFTDPELRARAERQLAELGKILVPSRSSYFGIFDLCGFRKDRFYIYQARWRPELPMAHILPHWTWPERVGQITPVHVYTSGDEAELFLNGRSLGRKKKGQFEYRLCWNDVVYEPGELKVVAYKNGKRWATDVVQTAGPAARLVLEPDRKSIRADGLELAFVTVKVTDSSGVVVPRAKHRIRFSLAGPGEIVATDNGDPTCHESFRSPERNAFNGLALVIVRALPGRPGTITLSAEADGLAPATVRIKSRHD